MLKLILFNWTSVDDKINLYHITLHYVEGYDAGNGNIGFHWMKLNSTSYFIDSFWYNWRIELENKKTRIYINNAKILTYNDTILMTGSIGLASFANYNSNFDNIYLWN